jgi:hypothetical protein
MRAPWPVESWRFEPQDRRLPAGSQAMRGAARSCDLGARGCAAQVTDDGAADADGVLLGKGSSEDVAPLTVRDPDGRGALYVHAPQPTRPPRERMG